MADFQGRTKASKVRSCLWRHGLTLTTLALGAAGLSTGLALRDRLSEETVMLVQLPGHVVMHGYSMLLVPLMACGITLGVASMRQSDSGRLLGVTLALFTSMMFLTSVVSCCLGRGLRLGHHTNFPSDFTDSDDPETMEIASERTVIVKTVVEFFENIMPENIFMATLMKKELRIEEIRNDSESNGTIRLNHELRHQFETNYVGLVVFFVIFGYALGVLGSRVNTIVLFLEEVNLTIMKIMEGYVKVLPVGLFFWLLCQGLRTESVGDMLARIGFYLCVFTAVQLLYHFLVLPLLYLLVVRKNPVNFHLRLMPLFCLAFGTASGATALPLALRVLEEGLSIDQRVTRLVLPLGSVFNQQGSTLGNPLTVFFIAGMQDVDIGIVRTILLSVTNVLMQLAIPNVPGSGMSVLWFLHFVGIYRPYVIGVIMAVMWFLDRLSACTNVIGDCYVAAFVEKLCGKQLSRSEFQDLRLEVNSLASEERSAQSSYVREETVSVY